MFKFKLEIISTSIYHYSNSFNFNIMVFTPIHSSLILVILFVEVSGLKQARGLSVCSFLFRQEMYKGIIHHEKLARFSSYVNKLLLYLRCILNQLNRYGLLINCQPQNSFLQRCEIFLLLGGVKRDVFMNQAKWGFFLGLVQLIIRLRNYCANGD